MISISLKVLIKAIKMTLNNVVEKELFQRNGLYSDIIIHSLGHVGVGRDAYTLYIVQEGEAIFGL